MNEKNVRSIPELFGSMVFSQAQMRQRLPERVYDAWQQCLIQGTSLDRSIADEIAAAGKLVTPGGAVEICRILGKDETLRRLNAGLAMLGA